MRCVAIKVVQPIGEFFLTALPADVLSKICFSKQRRRDDEGEDGFQRPEQAQRIKSIFEYLQTQEATLPGTLVLAANFTEDGEFVGDELNRDMFSKRWQATPVPLGLQSAFNNFYKEKNLSQPVGVDRLYDLEFPEDIKLAAVVDGQHRLGGFKGQTSASIKTMLLPCAVYIDLPIPLQAHIFATINLTQKPVSKSLTYEVFGYNLENEPPRAWSPDKFAVFLTRKLNVDNESPSPFMGHIKTAAIDCRSVDEKSFLKEWSVSTATVVTGIMSLISGNPQADRIVLDKLPLKERDRSVLTPLVDSRRVPLRGYYLECCDALIYDILINYFKAVYRLFSKSPREFDVFHKTAGVTSLFKVLKELLPAAIDLGDVSELTWLNLVGKQNKMVDFNDAYLRGSSGAHVGRIRDMLYLMAGRKHIEDYRGNQCFNEYSRIWENAEIIDNV